MAYVIYTPTGLFTKAMFNFSPNTNYLFSGIINVSVSDGFSNYDYALGLINSSNYAMNPYSNEIVWSQQVKDNIKSTLNIISAFANIVFSEVIDYDTSGFGAYSIASPADVGIYSDINISYMNANSTNLLGMSSGSTDFFGYPGSRGDVLINVTGSAFTQEGVTFSDYSKSRQVLLHELGHSLGLSHPFSAPNQISSNYKDLINAGFDKLGFNMANSSYIDKEYFTMMSYDDQSNISSNNAFTPMIFDVIALVNAYGEGTGTTGAGNDTINVGNRGYRTYFDKDGVDTVNLSLYSSGAYFNMGVVITDATHLVGVAMSLVDAQQTIVDGGNPAALRWFYGEYENALGSIGGDVLIGNNLSNNIDAGNGDDFILGGGGNDILDGGNGQDIAKYKLNRDNYIVSGSVGFYTVSSISGEEGSDRLINIETLSFADMAGGIGGFIDATPPTVLIFSPADEATLVSIGSNVVITFSEAIQRGTSDIVLKTAAGTTVATYSQTSSNVTISGSTLTINPTADLNYSIGYKVEFAAGSVIDAAGNNYAGTTTYNFTTGAAPDTTPPTVLTFSPADEATSVTIGSNIVVTFSESIQRGSGDIILKTAEGTTLAKYSQTSSNVTISGSTVTINPTEDLNYSTGYKVELAAGSVKDTAGNNYTGTTAYNFTSGAAPDTTAPTLLRQSPSANASNVAANSNLSLTFSESIQAGTGHVVLKKNGSTERTIAIGDNQIIINGSTLTLDPSTDLTSGATYTLEMATGVVKDMAGNAHAGLSNYSFTTQANVLTPSITFVSLGNLKLIKDTVKNISYLSFSVQLNSAQFNNQKVNGLVIDLDYNASLVSSANVTSAKYDNAGNATVVWQFITPNLSGSIATGKIAAIADSSSSNPILVSGKTMDVNMVLNQAVDTFTIGFNSQTASVTTSDKVSYVVGAAADTTVLASANFSLKAQANHWKPLSNSSTGKALSDVNFAVDSITAKSDSTGSATLSSLSNIQTTLTAVKSINNDADKAAVAKEVNLTDAIAILKMIVGLNVNSGSTELSPYQVVAADFNKDGTVGLTDAIDVLKAVVGLTSPAPSWVMLDQSKVNSTLTMSGYNNDTSKKQTNGWMSSALNLNMESTQEVKLVGVLTGDVDGSWTGV